MQPSTFALLAVLVTPLYVQAAPFEKGNPSKGETLHAESCTACHGTEVYTRATRKIKSASQLAARISGCNANTGAGWFPDDEQHVGAYLNQNFYKFK